MEDASLKAMWRNPMTFHRLAQTLCLILSFSLATGGCYSHTRVEIPKEQLQNHAVIRERDGSLYVSTNKGGNPSPALSSVRVERGTLIGELKDPGTTSQLTYALTDVRRVEEDKKEFDGSGTVLAFFGALVLGAVIGGAAWWSSTSWPK
jgi:hypothetical protein